VGAANVAERAGIGDAAVPGTGDRNTDGPNKNSELAIRNHFGRGSETMNREPWTGGLTAEGHFVEKRLKTVRNANRELRRIRVDPPDTHSHRPLDHIDRSGRTAIVAAMAMPRSGHSSGDTIHPHSQTNTHEFESPELDWKE
jgi:hypothetical protein